MNLLTRFYELTSGEILVDGKPLRSYGMKALREMVGLVTQESFLFNGTIRENLLMGKPDASDEEVLRAAEAANARSQPRTVDAGRPSRTRRPTACSGRPTTSA